VNVAKVDATQESVTANKFGINSFPQIKLFPAGIKNQNLAVDYEESRDLLSFTAFALRYHAQTVESEQLLNRAQLEESCSNNLCVIAFLPHILDSNKEGRLKYLEDYNTAARGSGGVPCTFLWSQGGDQYEFESKLNLGFGFPALVAIHMKKGKYGIHRGSFVQESIRGFLTSLMSGKVPLNDLPKDLPKIYKADAWDGEEGKPFEEEEL